MNDNRKSIKISSNFYFFIKLENKEMESFEQTIIRLINQGRIKYYPDIIYREGSVII